MKTRAAVPDDLSAVNELTRLAYQHYIPILGGEPWPMLVDYAPRIAAGEMWLLEDAHEPIALIALEDHGDHLHIFSVAVLPEHQSKGIGQKLLAFAETIAREMDRSALTLCTNERMQRNLGIYQLYGFTETQRRPNPNHAGWTLVDMEKRVAAARRKQESA